MRKTEKKVVPFSVQFTGKLFRAMSSVCRLERVYLNRKFEQFLLAPLPAAQRFCFKIVPEAEDHSRLINQCAVVYLSVEERSVLENLALEEGKSLGAKAREMAWFSWEFYIRLGRVASMLKPEEFASRLQRYLEERYARIH